MVFSYVLSWGGVRVGYPVSRTFTIDSFAATLKRNSSSQLGLFQ